MPPRGWKKTKPATFATSDPESLGGRFVEYLEWLQVQCYSKHTIKTRQNYLSWFIQWCDDRGLYHPRDISRPILERYQRHLHHHRQKMTGQPLTNLSKRSHLVPVKAFFKWLCRRDYLMYNPASELEMPRFEHRLPKNVLSAAEAEAVLNQPDVRTSTGIRDRAILETFYSTGMRRMEVSQLKLFHLDLERELVIVHKGKGNKDRMIPIGSRALAWIGKYLDEVRPDLVVAPDKEYVFLTIRGEYMLPSRLSELVSRHVNASQITKKGSCHMFRHTMATLMLENGADIRFIQQMLGHASIATTQIYTQVSVGKLKEIHAATHPGARLGRYGADDVDDGGDSCQVEEGKVMSKIDKD